MCPRFSVRGRVFVFVCVCGGGGGGGGLVYFFKTFLFKILMFSIRLVAAVAAFKSFFWVGPCDGVID